MSTTDDPDEFDMGAFIDGLPTLAESPAIQRLLASKSPWDAADKPAHPSEQDQWLAEYERLMDAYAKAVEATLVTDEPGVFRRRLAARNALTVHARQHPQAQAEPVAPDGMEPNYCNAEQCTCRMSFGYVACDQQPKWKPSRRATGAAPQAQADTLPPVEGDLLPAIGEVVQIHLNSLDAWVDHTVAGYYVWADLGGSKSLYRVAVRVRDQAGHLNARMLGDIRRTSTSALNTTPTQGEKS